MRKYNLPIFIPHRGCPHDCCFCNQRKITGVDTEITPNEIREKIGTFLGTVEKNSSVEVAFFGGSFTGLNLETQETFLRVASDFSTMIGGIRISTRPDYINEEILDLLERYNVTTIELGVQSRDDEVLTLNKRGHSFEDVVIASELIRERGIALGHQMMLGMYGSTPEKDMKTVEDIIAQKPDCVRIYPVVTLKGTALERFYIDGEYEPYSVEMAAELAKTAVCAFREHNIDVIRVGLHSSDELEKDDNIIAGPYHQAFGELVESLIYREKIEEEIMHKELRDCEFDFYCEKSEISKAIGHKRMNKEYFRDKYGVTIKVRKKAGIDDGKNS